VSRRARSRLRRCVLALVLAGALGVASAWAADGDLDPGFGDGGTVLLAQIAQPRAAIAEADGTLLLGGSDPAAGNAGTYVRVSASGALAGRRASDGYEVDGLAQAPGGTAVAALTGPDAQTGSLVAVTRLEPDLSPDPDFDHGRPARLAFPNGARATAVAVAPDGAVIVGALTGTSRDETARGLGSFALARFLPNGGLDVGFGDHGVAITPFPAPTHGVTALAFQADGRILAAGPVGAQGADVGVARYRADGRLDRSWSGGTVVTDLGGDERPLAISVAAGGAVTVAAASGHGLGLARYGETGTPGGATTAPFGTDGTVLDAAFLADGRILAAGEAGGRLAVARYDRGGAADSSFGAAGLAAPGAGDGPSLARRLVVEDGGGIVAAGDATAAGAARTALVRLRGSVPPGSGGGGFGAGTSGGASAGTCSAPGRRSAPRRARVRFPLPVRAGARATLRVAGFPRGEAVYLHAYRGVRLRYGARLGRAEGACGRLVVRRRLLPGAARPGAWVLSFGTRRTAPRRYVHGAGGERFARRVVVRRTRGRLMIAAPQAAPRRR
jgi:uncharacterized delta-60 repeat protein